MVQTGQQWLLPSASVNYCHQMEKGHQSVSPTHVPGILTHAYLLGNSFQHDREIINVFLNFCLKQANISSIFSFKDLKVWDLGSLYISMTSTRSFLKVRKSGIPQCSAQAGV